MSAPTYIPKTAKSPPKGTRSRWWSMVPVALVLIGAVVTWQRVPWQDHFVVWAEDGDVFLAQSIRQGALPVLLQDYAGYLHLLPRLIVAPIAWFAPLVAYPVTVFVVCALFVGLVAAAVYHLSRDLVPFIPARIALACITFLIPVSAQEVIGNLADLHTYCLWLAPWIVLSRPRGWAPAFGWAIVMLLCAMTEIQCVLFLLVVPFRLRARYRFSWPIFGALIFGCAAQIANTLAHPRVSHPSWPGLPALVNGYLINVTLPMLNVKAESEINYLMASGILIPFLLLIPFLVFGVVVLVFGSAPQRILVAGLAAASMATYAAAVIVDGSRAVRYDMNFGATFFDGYINLRYGVAAGLLLAAVVPVGVAVLATRGWARPRLGTGVRVLGVVTVVGLVAVFAVACTREGSSRYVQSVWAPQVEQAQHVTCAVSDPKREVTLAFAPVRTTTYTCAQLQPYFN